MRATPDRTVSSLHTSILRDSREFAALEEEWDDLHAHSPRATPFQSWAWLYSWWEHFGRDRGLRLISVRNPEGLLVGLVPLMLEPGTGRLLLVGTGLTDYLDVLIREGWEDEVARAGISALNHVGSWRIIDLQDLRPGAATWGLFEGWQGHRATLSQAGCPILDLQPWEELVSSLESKNLRSTTRRTLRKAESDGLRRTPVDAEQTQEAARHLVALHRESRQGRDIGAEHTSPRFESFVVATATRMAARGLGGISQVAGDEGVLVSDFWVSREGDFLGTYLLGASQEALERYQWSSLYIWDAVAKATDRGCEHLDFLRGDEAYKLRWSSRTVTNHRLILGRSAILVTAYVRFQQLRSRVEARVLSEDAAPWVKKAVAALRSVRRWNARRGEA